MSTLLQSTSKSVAAELAKRRPKRAIELAHKALLQPPAHPAIFAQALQRSGYFSPQQIAGTGIQAVWRDYGSFLARAGLLEESCQAFSIALALYPECYQSLNDSGTAHFTLGQFDGAITNFENASSINPKDPGPLANLAAIFARQGKAREARIYAKKALALDPSQMAAHLALARADLIDQQPEKAAEKMSVQLQRTDIAEQNRIALLDLRAEARDMSGDYSGAFADYEQRNQLLIRTNAARVVAAQPEREIDQTIRIGNFFRNSAKRWHKWAEVANTQALVRRHVFLVGFPRSGTTLVEKALAGHPDVVTLEEIDSLNGIAGQWTSDAARLGMLSGERPDPMSANGLRVCRDAYWQKVQSAAKADLSKRIVIDKMPLYTLHLPLIARLFPEAQILFAQRDPRDVVLSCFRRRFRINPAMFEFLTLQGTARYYDAVMSHARRCRELLPLPFHDMRHEAIVENFDREISAILKFLGLEWHDAVRQFAGRAALRPMTPSDPQLVRGLSSEGIGQWRKYRESLVPVQAILDPWAAAYGYPMD